MSSHLPFDLHPPVAASGGESGDDGSAVFLFHPPEPPQQEQTQTSSSPSSASSRPHDRPFTTQHTFPPAAPDSSASTPRATATAPTPDAAALTPAGEYAFFAKMGLHRRLSSDRTATTDPGSPSFGASSSSARWRDDSRSEATSWTTRSEAIQMQSIGTSFGETGRSSFKAHDSRSEILEDEDSPYPEVRASVGNWDDEAMPVLTVRSWTIGLLLSVVGGCANCFMVFRYPSPVLTPLAVALIAYPLGKSLAYLLPYRTLSLPFGYSLDLNPGPFNIKEHTIILLMANVAISPAYGLNFSVASDKFYGVEQGVGFDLLLVATSNMIGFGVAGLCQKFLVSPASMIWPQNLMLCTLLNTLHAEEDGDDAAGLGVKSMSRFRFLGYSTAGAFAWYFLPGYLFQALSAFSWVCWIAPNNVVVNQLFGVASGLGMSLFTFDWSQIAFIVSPFLVPWWAIANVAAVFAIVFWAIVPALYYSNAWSSSYLPISTSSVFDRFGNSYSSTSILTPSGDSLDQAAYAAYSPVFVPVTYAAYWGIAFTLTTATLVHTAIYHGREILGRFSGRNSERKDVHARLMERYKSIPGWWYAALMCLLLSLSMITLGCWDTRTPVWTVLVAVAFASVYVLPGGYIYAMTATQIQINVPTQLIAGYLLPGNPLANMLFKTYSLCTTTEALSFSQNLKLGHYMKIPPRATFVVQVVATLLSALAQVGIKRSLVAAVADFCDPKQAALLICPTTKAFYSSSVLWGVIGPSRLFGIGQAYNSLLYFLLLGVVGPIATWALARRFPTSRVLASVNLPVALNGALYIPPATGINYSSWVLVGFVSQYWFRRRSFATWSRYVFVLSSGLDAGTVLSAVFIFLTLRLPRNGTLNVSWWGNEVFARTADWAGLPYRLPPEGGFGPASWS